MLKPRIASGCLIGAAFILAANYVPLAGFYLLLALVAALAQLEFYSLINRSGIPVFRFLGVACGTGLISATFATLGPSTASHVEAYKWEHFVMLGALVAVFVRQFPQKNNPRPISTIACTLFGIWYVPYLVNFLARMALVWDEPTITATGQVSQTGRMLVLYLVVVVKCNDIGAFFTGKLIGRHKLFPRISPRKTWEGFFGGLLFSTAASYVFIVVLGGDFRAGLGITGPDALALGLLLGFAGAVGDLFESLVKRAAGAKDSGHSIPGMGGILDLLDSLLFGAPVLYVYIRLFL